MSIAYNHIYKRLSRPGIISGGTCGVIVGMGMGFILTAATRMLSTLIIIPLDVVFGLTAGGIAELVIRLLGTRANRKTGWFLTCTFYGFTIGALSLWPFSESMFMVIYLLIVGAIIGGVMGAVIGLIVASFLRID
jgi:uncharacterized membrane protein